jgi:hypothetical protein
MLLSLKCLAAAGLAASMATGGAIATQASAEHRPATVTVDATVTAPPDVPAVPGIDGQPPAAAGADKPQDAAEDTPTTTSTSTTSTTTTSPTTPPTSLPTSQAPAPAPAPAISVQSAGEAGTVTLSVDRGVLTATEVHPNAGWTVDEQELQGREIEVTFRNGLRRIEFKAELEDGQLRTRVNSETADDEGNESAERPGGEVGDDHGRDGVADHSGSGGGGDHSGHGGGDDHSGDSGH